MKLEDDGVVIDDVSADAEAAWREVMSKGEAEQAREPSPAPDASGESSRKTVESKPVVNRDEHGRFAPKSDKPSTETGDKPDAKPDANADTKEDDGPKIETAHEGGPPPSWSVKAKAAWDQLPAEVRADITKREGEVAQGLAALRDYKDLKPYAEMARQHNTTIKDALDRYVGIENVLKANLPQGLMQIAQNYGLTQEKAGHLFLDMGQRLLGTTPGAANGNGANGTQQQADDDPLNELLDPFVKPLMEKISALESKLSSREVADRNAQWQSLEGKLSELSQKPEFRFTNELMPHMVKLFEAGIVQRTGNFEADFKTAYDMAAKLHPEISEALIEQRLAEAREVERRREQEAVAQAKAASRSLTGSRTPGTIITNASGEEGQDDLEADVRRAYRLAMQA